MEELGHDWARRKLELDVKVGAAITDEGRVEVIDVVGRHDEDAALGRSNTINGVQQGRERDTTKGTTKFLILLLVVIVLVLVIVVLAFDKSSVDILKQENALCRERCKETSKTIFGKAPRS